MPLRDLIGGECHAADCDDARTRATAGGHGPVRWQVRHLLNPALSPIYMMEVVGSLKVSMSPWHPYAACLQPCRGK